MSYCQRCGSQNQNNSCTNNGCPKFSHVHGSNQPYTGHSSVHNQPASNHMQASQNIVVHQLLHPNACGDTPQNCLDGYSKTESTGRPILSGIFEARDTRGAAVPFAQVTITYTGTNNPVALFSDRNKTNALPNPARTDIYGRLPIYYGGGPIDILVEKLDSNGNPCGVVDKIFNEGGYVDSDFMLANDQIKECIDIENPLLRIYDQDGCNLPVGMSSPKFVLQWANWQSGLPIGTYSETKEFFECIGQDFTCGVLVFGDTTGNRFRYDCENCTQTCPPDPETVDFESDGTSECWIKLDEFSACIYDEVDYSETLRVLACDDGENVLTDVSACALDVYELETGETVEGVIGKVTNGSECKHRLVALPGGPTILDTPVNVLNVSRARADGTFDSGNVSSDLNALAGVTVPPGATSAILRCAVGINGQNTGGLGNVSELAFVHIEVAGAVGQINGGNPTSAGQYPTLAVYADTDAPDSDNDDTNDVFVPLNGSSIAYKAVIRFANDLGVDVGVARIYVVGFI